MTDRSMASSDSGGPVVAIGVKADDIAALAELLNAFSAAPGAALIERGVALILALPLAPESHDALLEVLGRSPVPVVAVDRKTPVERGRLYHAPPGEMLRFDEDGLDIADDGGEAPVDQLFGQLAAVCQSPFAGIVLPGHGSDGTLGIRAIRDAGGVAVALAAGRYDGTMHTALANEQLDLVLPVAEIPRRLGEYFATLPSATQIRDANAIDPKLPLFLPQIYELLRNRTGHDLQEYKDRTILRRLQRRMHVLDIHEAEAFVARIRSDSHELDLLFQDLLIGVTRFFRDEEAFKLLEKQVIPQLFDGLGPSESVRVWVPGCSTGEEAYSIAILLRENLPDSIDRSRLQVFASDIDERALTTARLGRYPASIAADVSPERLQRHFVREDGTYRVSVELREMCLFSVHDLLRDAPFSKLDLVSCRNLLIYFSAKLQNRVVPLFHYALRDSGFLFLGSSENIRVPRLFATVDKPSRIFQRRHLKEGRPPEFPLSSVRSRPERIRVRQTPRRVDRSMSSAVDALLLERHVPAHVVIDGDGDVLYASNKTGRYLELPAGVPDHNVFSMAKAGLRVDLRSAFNRAMDKAGTAQVRVAIGHDATDQSRRVDLIVEPLNGTGTGTSDKLYVILFRDVEIDSVPHVGDLLDQSAAGHHRGLRELEAELRATREHLASTTEELESSNEELRVGNEELSSVNEELQSANEELETSREELQSTNEELMTVNAELNMRVEELGRANNDIANLLESTQIATVFLDRLLNVKSFTPAAKQVFRLVESDVGRPISHVRMRFEPDTVQEDAGAVLRTQHQIERRVSSNDGRSRYVMRLLPYRTTEDAIVGVVVTFIDVTEIAAAEERVTRLAMDLRNRIESLQTILDLVPAGIFIKEAVDSDEVTVNRHGLGLMGLPADRNGPRRLQIDLRLGRGEQPLPKEEQPLYQAATHGQSVSFEGLLFQDGGKAIDVMISASPLFDNGGAVRGAIAAVVDVSQHRLAEARRQMLLDELQHRVKNIIATIDALAARMLRRAPSVESFRQAFSSRLGAMGRVHDLLVGESWAGATLKDLIAVSLEPFMNVDGANVSMNGPELLINRAHSAPLGMILHELATNAAKYGPLSVADGCVEIRWFTELKRGRREVVITWIESDGPPIDKPHEEGFGTRFVKRSLSYELDGQASLDFRAAGLQCELRFPHQPADDVPPPTDLG